MSAPTIRTVTFTIYDNSDREHVFEAECDPGTNGDIGMVAEVTEGPVAPSVVVVSVDGQGVECGRELGRLVWDEAWDAYEGRRG